MKRILLIGMLIMTTLLSFGQKAQQLKVYQKGGVVDTLRLTRGSTMEHSRLDADGVLQSDYVSVIINSEGTEHQYLFSAIDSLVLPNGRRVVFRGSTSDEPQYARKKTSFHGTFPGRGTNNVQFFWTENDRIRLDAGYESRAENLTSDKTGASFVFDGADFDAPSYMVYYPDKKVVIPSEQTQTGADNTDHIGVSGDCGTGTAVLNEADGSYSFTLSHKAAYLCFLPHIDYLPSAKITKIVLTCSEPIAGEYQLSSAGLYAGGKTSKSVTLHLNPLRSNDFFIGHNVNVEQDTCAAYMVIAPQNGSRTFTATYFVTDTLSRLATTYNQTFSFAPVANTVYPITCRIPESIFRNIDMGFERTWANVNLGGNIPCDVGNYYAWGETTAKALFTADSYAATVGNDVLDICGTEHDAATQSDWGNAWQLPSADDIDELLDKCTWERGTYNGTEGWLVTGTNNGNEDIQPHRIFLPFSGYMQGTSQQQPAGGYYWMGTRQEGSSLQADAFVLNRNDRAAVLMDNYLGMNIRPVRPILREFYIPTSGTETIDLRSHEPGYSIRIYDNGGPNGNYANGYHGYVKILCAEGYKLNIVGSINTEGCDVLYLYDTAEDGTNTEFAHASGTTTINATSKTNTVLMYFYSDGSVVYSGFDLKVTIQKMNTKYNIGVNDAVGGTLTSNVSQANPEDTVWLHATPADGYVLSHIRVETADTVLTIYDDDPRLFVSASSATRHYVLNDTVRVRDGNWYHDDSWFLMPYGDVTVTPFFTNSDDSLYVVMAGNDTTFVERKYIQRLIDNGMTKFQFCDYAGLHANYDNSVRGYMLIDAPAGYVMNYTGTTSLEGADHIYMYDGPSTAYTCIGDPHGSVSVQGHNNQQFFYFYTDGSVVYAGYDITVHLQEDLAESYNIPSSGTINLTEENLTRRFSLGMTSTKVYDSGGADAVYLNSCNGSLIYHLPEGYSVHIYGTSDTESNYDWLRIYDDGTQKISKSGRNQTIDYTSTGHVIQLQFTSDGSVQYSGVDLTIDFIPN